MLQGVVRYREFIRSRDGKQPVLAIVEGAHFGVEFTFLLLFDSFFVFANIGRGLGIRVRIRMTN